MSPEWKAANARALAGEQVATDEDRFERSDGTVQWLRWEVKPWHEVDGGIGGIIIFSEDITERRLMERELADHRTHLEQLLEERTARLQHQMEELEDLYNKAPCGYHSLAMDGIILRMNDTELNWLGYAREEVVGRKRMTDFMTPPSVATLQGAFPAIPGGGPHPGP